MKIFVTADNHFNHENIIRYCNRPFNSVEEMNEVMIERWNKKVGKNDLVIHLGDLCFWKRNPKIVGELKKRLNGIVILILGNHDNPRLLTESGFMVVRGSLQIGNLLLSHAPVPKKDLPRRLVNVHGHIHQRESFHGINVSVERTDYSPIELDKLIDELENEDEN